MSNSSTFGGRLPSLYQLNLHINYTPLPPVYSEVHHILDIFKLLGAAGGGQEQEQGQHCEAGGRRQWRRWTGSEDKEHFIGNSIVLYVQCRLQGRVWTGN